MPNEISSRIILSGDPFHVTRAANAIANRSDPFSFEKIGELYADAIGLDNKNPINALLKERNGQPGYHRGCKIHLNRREFVEYEVSTPWVYPLPQVLMVSKVFPVNIVLSATAWEWMDENQMAPVEWYFVADGQVVRSWTENGRWEMGRPNHLARLWRKIVSRRAASSIRRPTTIDDGIPF